MKRWKEMLEKFKVVEINKRLLEEESAAAAEI